MSLLPVRVTVVHVPLQPEQVPPLSVATSRCTTLEPGARPEPESLPPLTVTGTDRAV